MIDFLIGALSAGLLLVSAYHLAYRRSSSRQLDLAMAQGTRALDAARAAELRSAQQIDAMLDRISTSPRIEVRPAVATGLSERPYISDEPYHDGAWNDLRGVSDEDADE